MTESGPLGIYGGTFDPPHIGHFILAAEAYQQLGLKRVLWVLTPDPPHKHDHSITPLSERLAMLQAALDQAAQSGEVNFELSRVEIDRSPPHYAVDTLRLLRQQNPQAFLVYLMGGDSLDDLPTWHQPQEFVDLCNQIGVMRRPASMPDLPYLENQLHGLQEKVRYFETPLLQISSSRLREWLAEGRNCRYYFPPGVWEVIQAQQIYR